MERPRGKPRDEVTFRERLQSYGPACTRLWTMRCIFVQVGVVLLGAGLTAGVTGLSSSDGTCTDWYQKKRMAPTLFSLNRTTCRRPPCQRDRHQLHTPPLPKLREGPWR